MFKREHFKETNKGKVVKAKAVHSYKPVEASVWAKEQNSSELSNQKTKLL